MIAAIVAILITGNPDGLRLAGGEESRIECLYEDERPKLRAAGKWAAGWRVTALLDRPPPSRTRLNFDLPTGEHAEITWDPLVSVHLARSVVLTKGTEKEAKWQLSVSSERIPDPTDPAKDFAWTYSPKNQERVSAGRSCILRLSTQIAGEWVGVQITAETPPLLSDAAGNIATVQGGKAGGPEAGRMFGLPSTEDAATELFKVVSEILVERGKARAYEILRNKIQGFVCDDLVIRGSGQLYELLFGDKVQVEDDYVLVPRTCEVVKHLRLEELAASGGGLLRAVLQDATGVLTRSAMVRLAALGPREREHWNQARSSLRLVFDAMGRVVAEAITRPEPWSTSATAFMVSLVRYRWSDNLPVNDSRDAELKLFGCGVDLAFAVMAECHAQGNCDARAIADFVERSPAYFNLDSCRAAASQASNESDPVRAIRERWPDLELMIAHGIDILAPPKGSNAVAQLRASVALAFDIIDHFACAAAEDPSACRQVLASGVETHEAGGRQSQALRTALEKLTKACKETKACAKTLNEVLTSECKNDCKDVLEEDIVKTLNYSPNQSAGMLNMLTRLAAPNPPNDPDVMSAVAMTRRIVIDQITASNLKLFKVVRRAVDGAVTENVQETVAATAELIELALSSPPTYIKEDREVVTTFDKAAKIVAAAASYVQSYSPGSSAQGHPSDGELKAAHEERKKAIESLIEATTSRVGRDGEWVVSLGGGIRFGGAVRWANKTDNQSVTNGYASLTVPLGISVERLPGPDAGLCASGPNGFCWPHIEIAVLDLGQYVPLDPARSGAKLHVADALSVSAMVGVSFGRDLPIIIGPSVGYLPHFKYQNSVSADKRGAWILAGTIGVHVPLIDLN